MAIEEERRAARVAKLDALHGAVERLVTGGRLGGSIAVRRPIPLAQPSSTTRC